VIVHHVLKPFVALFPYHTAHHVLGIALLPPASSSRRPALVALVCITLIWSYNWIVMKQVLRYCGPFDFCVLRYALGCAVLFAALMIRGESLRPPPLMPTILIGLTQTMGFQALVQWALVGGGAGKTALLAYTMPFWVVPIAWFVLGERPALRLWCGLALAACGLVFVLEPWQGLGDLRNPLLAVGAGACWATGVVLSKRLFLRGGMGALSLTAWQMLFGTLGLVIVALPTHAQPIQWSGFFIGALAYNAILATGLAWLMWSHIVARLPADIAGLASLVIPIAGIGFAWALLGERPSPTEAVGIVLIGIALAVVTLRWPLRPARAP
jgi:drug/metabolite transporter (DMT)-like permease